MFWKVTSAATELPSESFVTAVDVPAHRPLTDMECWVLSVLLARRSMSLTDLVQLVADRLYREALGQGAAAVDIGLFGVKLFNSEALAVVARGHERWWTIGNAENRLAFAAVRPAGEFAAKSGLES